MFAIARSEMTQLVRNRLVAASSLFIPLAFSAVLSSTARTSGAPR